MRCTSEDFCRSAARLAPAQCAPGSLSAPAAGGGKMAATRNAAFRCAGFCARRDAEAQGPGVREELGGRRSREFNDQVKRGRGAPLRGAGVREDARGGGENDLYKKWRARREGALPPPVLRGLT